MINFCFDATIDGVGYPNLAKHKAKPYTQQWRNFDKHEPYVVPLRLLMYLDYARISYTISNVASSADDSWYPVAFSWFNFDIDYISLIPESTKIRIQNGTIKILFFYHEGDNPARIKDRIDMLCATHLMPHNCYCFVSANTASRQLNNFIYFSDHEFFFRYLNRNQAVVDSDNDRPFIFTMLNRTHKWWRASCVEDLLSHNLLDNSLWSYQTDCTINDDPEDNPIELDSVSGWRKRVDRFVKNGPYICDNFTSEQQNNHHWVNQDLYSKSYFHLITETHFDADQSDGTFITEKTFKPIKYGQPFVVIGPHGTLSELRNMGYSTFDHVIDNRYDQERNNTKRWQLVRNAIQQIQYNNPHLIFQRCIDEIRHNQEMFNSRNKEPLNMLIEKITCQT
jgi:hypothetical protein